MVNRVFGAVPNVNEGDTFPTFADLQAAGVHKTPQRGIVGGAKEGCESICLNGGYGDDRDFGHWIIYTGEGGKENGVHVRDQTLTGGNAALVVSYENGTPVRVIRGFNGDKTYGPSKAQGYRYDGLFEVFKYQRLASDVSPPYKVWKYWLSKIGVVQNLPVGSSAPGARQSISGTRPVRNEKLADRIKRLHDYTCQICGIRLETPHWAYAEAAHIKPIGTPTNGPDVESNILCLCPNHHKLFDKGGIVIRDDLRVLDLMTHRIGPALSTKPGHKIDLNQIRWHRQNWGP